MSDTPPRSVPPARTDELIETGNPAVDPLSGRPSGSDQSTVTTGRTPTVPNTEHIPDVPGYVIVEKIGEGGMGAVFLATDARLGRRAAIKTMKPALAAEPANRDRFFREAKAAAAVEHDYIVPIWQVGEAADGTPFIAMPFLKGEPLDVRLKREPVAALDLILKVGLEVAEGLAEAHKQGLIHRDIKPGNVWLEGDLSEAGQFRRCKILDFGLARSVDANDAHHTASGVILGTPAYMAPEQARGERVGHRADLFSLGVMLYRMATGEQPFKGDTAMSVLVALATETPPPVRALASDLPPELLDLIERLMCKEPGGRPQSAAEVVAVVRSLAARGPSSAPRVRTPAVDSFARAPTASLRPLAGATAEYPAAPPRTIRSRVTEWVGIAALVPLVTAAGAALWLVVQPSAPWTTLTRAFLLATVLAWAVALVSLVPVRDGWRRWGRYAIQFAVGASIGAIALWSDGWALSAESADGHDFALPGGAHIGRDTIWVGLQYALFFGLAVCAGRWWWDSLCALRAPNGERTFRLSWDLLRAPLLLLALVLAWPNQTAPLGFAVLLLGAALVAQVARPLARSAPQPARA